MTFPVLDDRQWHDPGDVVNSVGPQTAARLEAAEKLLDAIAAGTVEVRHRDGRAQIRRRHGHQLPAAVTIHIESPAKPDVIFIPVADPRLPPVRR